MHRGVFVGHVTFDWILSVKLDNVMPVKLKICIESYTIKPCIILFDDGLHGIDKKGLNK
jgi:hypothetical protein